MKNIYAVILLLITLTVPAVSQASSYYVTLEGTVNSIQDNGGLASSANIGVGANVRYVLEIDTDRLGSVTRNGRTWDKQNTVYSGLYAGVLSGGMWYENNFLQENPAEFKAEAANSLSGVYLKDWNTKLDDLTVGTKLGYMHEFSYNPDNNWKYTQLNLKDMTVTNISNVAPTPIPGAAFIMLGGLGVVGALRRKFGK